MMRIFHHWDENVIQNPNSKLHLHSCINTIHHIILFEDELQSFAMDADYSRKIPGSWLHSPLSYRITKYDDLHYEGRALKLY